MSLLAVTSGSSGSSLVTPEGIDFDGVTDYLSRNTYLSGGVATKTFTFSCFVYNATSLETRVVAEFLGDLGAGYNIFRVIVTENNIQLIGYNQSISIILNCSVSTGNAPKNSWYNFICSVDLSNSSKRHMYINDVSKGVFDTFTNDSIAFNKPSLIYIGKPVPNNGNLNFKGRLSNVFLDYTYRDLSIEANRRLFITADGKPTPTATLKALNPILYLPMKDASTAHINEGTGGNFTLNGTIATSNRGANQQNCTQLSLDGTADYLSRSGLSGTSSKELLISVNTKAKESATLSIISTRPITLQHIPASSKFSLKAYNSSNVLILSVDIPIYSTSLNIEYSLQCSVDLTNTSNRKVQLNGVDITASCTWITYTNDNIEYSYVGTISIGLATDYQEIGELYLGNSYLSNLSSFWDSVENKPIPVRKVIANTGVTPLIAMPLDASNAGKNYGSGGDFVANSEPYIGSRGASEFWCRSILVDATKYLTYTGGLFCASLVKWVSTDSGVTWAVSYLNNVTVTNIGNGTDNGRVAYYFGTSEVINWALEVNTLRFTDGLGYPIQPTIDSNTLLYLPFDNISNLGYNMGNANDLTIVGSVVNSSDVKG